MFKKIIVAVVFSFSIVIPFAAFAQVNSSASLSGAFCPSRVLSMGAQGADVVQLQQVLISAGLLPSDDATGYFGALTQAAVQQLQARLGIVSSGTPSSTGFGVVGPHTASVLCSVASLNIGGTVNSTNTVTSGVPNATQNVAFSATPLSGAAPLSVSFTSTPQQGGTYSISFGDQTNGSLGSVESCSGSNNTGVCIYLTTHTYTSSGTFVAQILSGTTVVGSATVTVSAANTNTNTTNTSVANTSPVTISSVASSSGGPLAATVQFASIACGTQYLLDWGDHTAQASVAAPANCTTAAANVTASHTYAASGTYTVTLYALQNGTEVSVGTTTYNTQVASASCPNFTRTLVVGLEGSDVLALQQFLTAQNLLPAEDDSGYFGSLTQAAVQYWQTSHNIVSSGSPSTTGYGAVGPTTSASITGACGSPSTTSGDSLIATPSSGGAPLTVTFSGTGPFGYAIDYGDGTPVATPGCGGSPCGSSTGPVNDSHTYTTAGTYTAKLMQGGTTFATATITVGSGTVAAPTTALFSATTTPAGSLTVQFTANVLGQASLYSVDFGDGTNGIAWTQGNTTGSLTVKHTYPTSSNYTATLYQTSTGTQVNGNNCTGACAQIVALANQPIKTSIATVQVSVGGDLTNKPAFTPTLTALASVTDKTTFFTALYNCALGRAPDTAGLAYWTAAASTNGITNFYEAYQNIFGSPEYLSNKTSDQQFVNQLYQCVLYRPQATTDGTYWITSLAAGTSRKSVLQSFLIGTEFQNSIAPALTKATGFSASVSAISAN